MQLKNKMRESILNLLINKNKCILNIFIVFCKIKINNSYLK